MSVAPGFGVGQAEAEPSMNRRLKPGSGEGRKITIKARAKAQAIRDVAEAEAEAHVVKAKAEAEALEHIAQALQQRDNLLTYRYIDKLSPNIRAMLLPNNAPLILPMPQLNDADQPQAAVLEQAPAETPASPQLVQDSTPPKSTATTTANTP